MQSTLPNNTEIQVDYLFAGMGAANSLILLSFFQLDLLKAKKIAVFEPQLQNLKEKTLCFWTTEDEIDKYRLKNLISYQWSSIKISNFDSQSISPYQYYCIQGKDLYASVIEVLNQCQAIQFNDVLPSNAKVVDAGIQFQHNTISLNSKKVFDNRTPGYFPPDSNEAHLLQSFYGWRINTHADVFETDVATLMDFTIEQDNTCQFIYVLPHNKNEALIEVTRFDKKLIEKGEAESILEKYIRSKFSDSYKIIEEEQGCIPMSSAKLKFERIKSKEWIYTGARANLIKPSTGYGFLNMANQAHAITQAEIENKKVKTFNRKARFTFYDRLLLKILDDNPSSGKQIFQTLFSNIKTKNVLTFLHEKSNVAEELKIFSFLPILLFLKFSFKDLFKFLKDLPATVQALVVTCLVLSFQYFRLPQVTWIILLVGFFSVGMAHGALDHIANKNIKTRNDLFKFILVYIGKAAVLGIVWFLFPDLALLFFILFSAWHFGQGDFNEWNLSFGIPSFLWGICLLGILLSFHFAETIAILENIPNLKIAYYLKQVGENELMVFQSIFLITGFILSLYTRSLMLIVSIVNLMLLSYLPLIIGFGIYFVFQHSMHGWKHLKKDLRLTSQKMWINALPYSLAGTAFIAYFVFENNATNWGVFFILLACISMPHVFSMDSFYRKSIVKSI